MPEISLFSRFHIILLPVSTFSSEAISDKSFVEIDVYTIFGR